MIEVKPADCLILNVDDYVPGRYARTRLLRQAGYQVMEAGSGKETLDAITLHNLDLILLDVNLPDMSGFDVCRLIRDNPRTEAMTILHISASSVLSQHQVSGLNSGADAYLVEPIDPALLLATVNAFLRARRAEEGMRRSNEELRWFAQRVGHDLNEPLRTITTYAQLLSRQPGLRAESATAIDFMVRGAARMRLFLDALLQYSQASTSNHVVQEIDCEVMLARAISSLDSAIRESGASVTCDTLPKIEGSSLLEQVFQNLISNAIKYRKPGVAPQIHVSARYEDGAWLFSVSDNGIGIPAEFRERVFIAFQRLHGQEIPGTGLGLTLVRKVAEAHGGKVWVESEEGQGSVFWLRLPSPEPEKYTSQASSR